MSRLLKPCPFCGGAEVVMEAARASIGAVIWCHSCGVRVCVKLYGKGKLEYETEKAWNRRTPDPQRPSPEGLHAQKLREEASDE